jgi:hypothetical protein
MVVIIKETPEVKPRCLSSVTLSVGKTGPTGSASTVDAMDTRRCALTGDSV